TVYGACPKDGNVAFGGDHTGEGGGAYVEYIEATTVTGYFEAFVVVSWVTGVGDVSGGEGAVYWEGNSPVKYLIKLLVRHYCEVESFFDGLGGEGTCYAKSDLLCNGHSTEDVDDNPCARGDTEGDGATSGIGCAGNGVARSLEDTIEVDSEVAVVVEECREGVGREDVVPCVGVAVGGGADTHGAPLLNGDFADPAFRGWDGHGFGFFDGGRAPRGLAEGGVFAVESFPGHALVVVLKALEGE